MSISFFIMTQLHIESCLLPSRHFLHVWLVIFLSFFAKTYNLIYCHFENGRIHVCKFVFFKVHHILKIHLHVYQDQHIQAPLSNHPRAPNQHKQGKLAYLPWPLVKRIYIFWKEGHSSLRSEEPNLI